MNTQVFQGQFNGAEIEPGTFHIRDTQNSNASAEKNVSSNNGEMPDLEDENKEPDTVLGPEDVTCY